jgi:hypothetical protein
VADPVGGNERTLQSYEAAIDAYVAGMSSNLAVAQVEMR